MKRDRQKFERLCQSTEESEESLTELEAQDIVTDFQDYYQHLQSFEQSQEPPKVKHISRFFNAIRNWLDENPLADDGAFVSPGGWLA